MKTWWEKEPVRFECQKGCIQCCSKPGWVYFDREDLDQASVFLHMSSSDFRVQYGLRPSRPGHWEMEVRDNRPCPFLGLQGCTIHAVKPKQCRAFPFWEENLASRKAWDRTGEQCPGIGEGPAWPPEVIRDKMDSVWP